MHVMTRRWVLVLGAAGLIVALGLASGPLASRSASVAAACREHAKLTPRRGLPQPGVDLYRDPGSAQRSDLREAGYPGVGLMLSGRVFDTGCRPMARVMLDFFHADSHGRYDRRQIRFHGHQYTDEEGRYLLRTIVPKGYLRRAPHIHVAVQAEGGPLLTTQLFFPPTLRAYGMNVAALNAHDPGFSKVLTVRLGSRRSSGYSAMFDFVIARG